ncbi:MAG: hypothetical protein K2X48_17775 [Chitinophagaceae bacterium]|nr:hypothetical protein [Chitinophagaceae bacterium]
MKRSTLLLLIAVIAIIAVLLWIILNRGKRPQEDPTLGNRDAKSSTVQPKKVRDKQYPPFTPKAEDPNMDKPYKVPDGPKRGDLKPVNSKIELKKIDFDSSGNPLNPAGAAINFYKFQNERTGGGVNITPDVNAAANRGVVLYSYNSSVRLSTDSGRTFTTINPTTIFPSGPVTDAAGNNISNGFCCDQIIQYVPSIDRFIWFMQFCGNGANCLLGRNIIRVASASTADIISSGATAWTYWDITSTQVGATAGALDYPDVSVGDNWIYISSDAVNTGLIVMRLPLREIQLGTGFTFWFTQATDGGNAYGGHVSQNTGNEVYWAGHVSISKMRLFSWRESETVYYWRDRDINSWTQAYSSNTPSGVNWLAFGFPGNAVLGVTRRNNEVWYAWNAGAGGGFTNAQIQVVKVRNTDYSVIEQMQIWNNDYAFAYPCFATNTDNEVGISLGWGGRTTEAHHAAGFMGDFIVYYPRLSTSSVNRYGDYVSIRRFNTNVVSNPHPTAPNSWQVER